VFFKFAKFKILYFKGFDFANSFQIQFEIKAFFT